VNVLLIDADVAFRDDLSAGLDRFGIGVLWRARVLGLVEAVTHTEPAALILSTDLPAADPLELIRAIRQQPSWARLPVFLVGSEVDRMLELRAYAEGADAVMLRKTATPELAARLLGRSTMEARTRCGTAMSIADAALALCAVPQAPAATPVVATLQPVFTLAPDPSGTAPPTHGPPPIQQPIHPPPQAHPTAPAFTPANAYAAPPMHTAAHAPPNGQFTPPDGYGAPPANAPYAIGGLGAEYRGAPPVAASAASVPDVIVVEDDPSLLEMLRYALTNRGFSTLSFSNGLDALRAMREMDTAGRHPVVLLDVDLPGLDGFRILHELSGARPGLFQVILCTVHSSEATQVLGIQSGAIDYLVKPLRMPIVLAKVERLLGRGGLSSAVGQ
jgi:DNA-binding response OmpR family regulator